MMDLEFQMRFKNEREILGEFLGLSKVVFLTLESFA